MGGDGQDLLAELKTLRGGRGLNAGDLAQKIGPNLRALAGLTGDEQPGLVRARLIERLRSLIAALPPDLAVAAEVALGLHPQARHQFVQDRTDWLARQILRDARTARRRMDEALLRLAELAGMAASSAPGDPGDDREAYHIEEFTALLRLDRPAPEAIDRRVIVAHVDLDGLDSVLTLPRDPNGGPSHELEVEVLYGATLVERERPADNRFQFGLKFPELVPAGERHEYGMLFRVPTGQSMRTHYVFFSYRRCDAFDLRVRFDPERMPTDVRRVDGAFARDLDGAAAGIPMSVDPAGELHLRFTDLRIGLGYGARWTLPG
jgi:hypothetical protein